MNDKKGLIMDAIRTVFGALDWILYLILGWAYEIFFDVSTVEFFSNETIRHFFSRIQLILGVFMVFKISVSILQAIVDPEKISDKTNGFSAYIKRTVICLIMLTLLIPRNIPNAQSEYEIQINNNGLLFGTLYSLQGRIMRNNTLGKLILGTSNDVVEVANSSDSTNQGNDQAKNMKEIGREFTTTILKGFLEENENCNNFGSTDAGKAYNDESSDATDLLMRNINNECSNHYYALYYYPIVGGVVAAVFAFILVGFSIDIAVRALKIAVLRLIAPIPIISYLDPNQEKKGAFGNWVKILTSTYLDLFIRLAIVYFVVFLIADIRKNGIIIGTETEGIMSLLVYVVICFGLFFFAKQAPKFIKDALGIQNSMQNIGLASLLGGTAMALGGGGLAGFGFGAMNGAQGQVDAYNQGKSLPLTGAWSSNRDLMEKIRTGDKDAQGGIWGRANDFLNYQTRERAASKLGIGAKDFAKASYIEDSAKMAEEKAKASMEAAQHDLSRLQLNGRKMNMADFSKYYKGQATDANGNYTPEFQNAFSNYEKQYQKATQMVNDTTSDYAAAAKALEKASKDKARIDKERDIMKVGPRVSDVEGRVTYRTNYSVVTQDNESLPDYGFAVDKQGRTVDANGNPISQDNYQYKQKPKNYNGTLDDETVRSMRGQHRH